MCHVNWHDILKIQHDVECVRRQCEVVGTLFGYIAEYVWIKSYPMRGERRASITPPLCFVILRGRNQALFLEREVPISAD